MTKPKEYRDFNTYSDVVAENQLPLYFSPHSQPDAAKDLNVLSLFSGCGGMDLGFEGNFIVHRKSATTSSNSIHSEINDNLVWPKNTRFRTILANDIL